MVNLININALLGSFGTVMLCNKAASDKHFFIVCFIASVSTSSSSQPQDNSLFLAVPLLMETGLNLMEFFQLRLQNLIPPCFGMPMSYHTDKLKEMRMKNRYNQPFLLGNVNRSQIWISMNV